jgi:hypothetical protein
VTRPPRNPRRAYDADGREIPPMDLANMREYGVRSVEASCVGIGCGHEASVNVDYLPEHVLVPDVALRLRSSACGSAQREDNSRLGTRAAGCASTAAGATVRTYQPSDASDAAPANLLWWHAPALWR